MRSSDVPPNRLYVGTHRRALRADPADTAFGIYGFEQSGSSYQPIGITATPQPGWIAAHPKGGLLYAVNEVRDLDGHPGGGVSAFAIDAASGALTALNTQPTPPMPCHCEVDQTGRFLLVATFGGGSVHLFPIEDDGRIGPECDAHHHSGSSIHPRRQTEPHAHAVSIDPGNRFVLVPDLGTDRLMVYELDQARSCLIARDDRTIALPPGSGPRHIAFGDAGRVVYLVNEMSATVTVFAFDGKTAELRLLQTADLLPDGFGGLRSGAAIAVHPSGAHLYATTRSHGSSELPEKPGLNLLIWFAIDPRDGTLQLSGSVLSGGEIPRSFAFDASGEELFVGHQGSGTLVTFQIDPTTGTPVPQPNPLLTPVPVCLTFVPGSAAER